MWEPDATWLGTGIGIIILLYHNQQKSLISWTDVRKHHNFFHISKNISHIIFQVMRTSYCGWSWSRQWQFLLSYLLLLSCALWRKSRGVAVAMKRSPMKWVRKLADSVLVVFVGILAPKERFGMLWIWSNWCKIRCWKDLPLCCRAIMECTAKEYSVCCVALVRSTCMYDYIN